MDKVELWRLIQELEKKHRRNRIKRFLCVVLLYAAILMVLCFWREQFYGMPIIEIICVFLACVLLGAIFVALNSIVFFQLFALNDHDKKTLEYYENALEKLLKEEKINQ